MDLQFSSSRLNNTMAKRLWRILRVTFFMIRKGLISKRKLIMDMNLMMKRGKLLRKNVTNLIFHHHRHMTAAEATAAARRSGYGIQEYEFSCSNSPNPVFFRALKRKRAALSYFPCMNPPRVIEEDEDHQWRRRRSSATATAGLNNELKMVVAAKTMSPEYNYYDADGSSESLLASPFGVRVSSFSSEDEEDDDINGVDDEAEEFIRRFYEQLRTQGRTQLLQYADQDDYN